MIGQRLTMRADVERNFASGTDAWGQPAEPQFAHHAILRCFAWSPSARTVADGDKVAGIEDMRALFALDADIAEHDVLAEITDAKGRKVFDGRLRVDGPVQYKHTHREVALKRVG